MLRKIFHQDKLLLGKRTILDIESKVCDFRSKVFVKLFGCYFLDEVNQNFTFKTRQSQAI